MPPRPVEEGRAQDRGWGWGEMVAGFGIGLRNGQMRMGPSTLDQATIAAARAVVPVFSGGRLAAIRELLGMTQVEVANKTGLTPSALSQAERGGTTLSAMNIARVASVLDVMPEAFAERADPVLALRAQFRHLRRTSVRERRMAEQFILGAAAVASILRDEVRFPTEPFGFTCAVDPDRPIGEVAEQVEDAAAQARSELRVEASEPIGSEMVNILEKGGVIVVRDPETGPDIDAYSAVVDGLPVIVLDGGEQSVWDRDNFNLAHELGHLVMHQGIGHRPGTRTVEAQAHRFAGAFLGPADALRRELPTELDWSRYLQLKRRWGLSIFALVRRAKDLGVIDDATYTRAMKQRSAHGWRTAEPGSKDRGLPAPQFLGQAVSLANISSTELASRSHLPRAVVDRIIGDQPPALTA